MQDTRNGIPVGTKSATVLGTEVSDECSKEEARGKRMNAMLRGGRGASKTRQR